MLADLARDDLELWGFDGVPTVACGFSLPIVRHKSSDRFCALSVARRGGPGWSSRSEIEEHLRLGRVTRLTEPLVLPERLFPLPSSGQPVVAWAQPIFWLSVFPENDEQAILCYTRELGWQKQTVESLFVIDKRTLQNSFLWVACASKAEVEHDLDSWARKYLNLYDVQLVTAAPNWRWLEALADHGLCAARSPATRYHLYVRYGTAMYYSNVTRPAVGPLERCTQLFRVVVKNEFPTVDWERFRADMVAVVTRSRDVLRLEVETDSIQALSERIAQTSAAPIAQQQRAVQVQVP